MRVYRLNAVGKEGRPVVLGTADTAKQALANLRAAFGDFPRAWITDEQDEDVSLADLMRNAEEEDEQLSAKGSQSPGANG